MISSNSNVQGLAFEEYQWDFNATTQGRLQMSCISLVQVKPTFLLILLAHVHVGLQLLFIGKIGVYKLNNSSYQPVISNKKCTNAASVFCFDISSVQLLDRASQCWLNSNPSSSNFDK